MYARCNWRAFYKNTKLNYFECTYAIFIFLSSILLQDIQQKIYQKEQSFFLRTNHRLTAVFHFGKCN